MNQLGPGGRIRQDRVGVRHPAVADPLLAAVDLVAGDPVAVHHPLGGGLQRRQVAAGVRLGGAVGEQNPFFRDARQPDLLLLRRGAHRDRIAAQKRGQYRGGHAQIDARHLFAHAIHVERAAAHAAVFFGDEQKLDAQLVRAAHVPHDLDRAFVARIQVDQNLVRQALLAEIPERFQAQFQRLFCDHWLGLTFREFWRSIPAEIPKCRRRFPTSATRNMGALGFLLMATMKGLPLMPARCWNDPLMPQAR